MHKVKKVFKYGTGHEIPEEAVYLHTRTERGTINFGTAQETKIDFVWHYFLVEVEK